MQFCIKNKFCFFFLFIPVLFYAQNKPEDSLVYIKILYAEHAATSDKYPGKQLLSGDVQIEHNGAFLYCDKAISR